MGERQDSVPQDVANVHVEHPATCFVRLFNGKLLFGFVGDCNAVAQHAFKSQN